MGALTGAVSGAFFGGVGSYLGAAAKVSAVATTTQVGLHAAAGMVAGGINSAITGGNIGPGILTGGIGAGMGSYVGSLLPNQIAAQLAGQTISGAISGGIAAEIYGGDFMDGFISGGEMAAFGYICNDFLHTYMKNWKDINRFFYSGVTKFTRTALGLITSGGVAKTFGTEPPAGAIKRALFPPKLGGQPMRVPPTLGVSGTIAASAIHWTLNSITCGASLEVGISLGALVPSIPVYGGNSTIGDWYGDKFYEISNE